MQRTTTLMLALAATGGCAMIAGLEDGELRPDANVGGATSVGPGSGAGTTTTTAAGGASTGGGGATSTGGSSGVGGMVPGMINIPGATFMMGCNDGVDDLCDSDEDPYHEVSLTGFRIDMNEVTRGDYFQCVDDGTCTAPDCDWDPTGMNLQEHPVTCVTWDQAVAYCSWVGKRLPTEAEWEYAARGQTGNRYPWGNSFDDNCSFANGNLCRFDTAEVGTHPTGASPFGAMDMAGNVAEWVADFYGADYYAVSPTQDPPGPAMGGTRVIRGGSWNSAIFNFRTSSRDAQVPTFSDEETGFRCAL